MEIEYKFNIGDKLKVVNGGLFTDMLIGATGVITSELKANGFVNMAHGFSLEILEPEKFKGEVWRFSCLGEYELLEVSDSNNTIKFKDTKEYKTIVKQGMICFEKKNYIEFENGSYIIGLDIGMDKDKTTRGNKANFITLIDNNFEVKECNNKFICIKDCIYSSGTIIEVIDRFKDYVVIAEGRNKNVFTYEEFKEYFTEYIDVNKCKFKVISKVNK